MHNSHFRISNVYRGIKIDFRIHVSIDISSTKTQREIEKRIIKFSVLISTRIQMMTMQIFIGSLLNWCYLFHFRGHVDLFGWMLSQNEMQKYKNGNE